MDHQIMNGKQREQMTVMGSHDCDSSESPDYDSSFQTLDGFSALEDAHGFRIWYICELRNLCARRGEAPTFFNHESCDLLTGAA